MEIIIDALNDKKNDEFILSILLVPTILLWNKKIEDKKLIHKARDMFTSLQNDPNSVLFSEEKIDERLFKKFKKSKYAKDSILLKIINLVDIKLDN